MKHKELYIIAFALLIHWGAKAQVHNFEEALTSLYKNHPSFKAASNEIAVQQQLAKAATDPGKTNVTINYGQFNSYRLDQSILISQNIPFPGSNMQKKMAANTDVSLATQQLQLLRNRLARELALQWNQLLFLNETKLILQFKDSLYSLLLSAVKLRLKAGETSAVETLNTENQKMENELDLAQTIAEIKHLQQKISLSIYTTIELTNMKLPEADLAQEMDSSKLTQFAGNIFFQTLATKAERERKLMQYNFYPEISLGYFNQSLGGWQDTDNKTSLFYNKSTRFHGVVLGLTIPIFIAPIKAKVKSAQIREQQAKLEVQAAQLSNYTDWFDAYELRSKNVGRIKFYKNNAIPQAQILLQKSHQAYLAGETGYMEYLNTIQWSINTQKNYIDALSNYHEARIKLNYYIINY
jgi:cobalt-zinc-cadmium resistance protein CzcA